MKICENPDTIEMLSKFERLLNQFRCLCVLCQKERRREKERIQSESGIYRKLISSILPEKWYTYHFEQITTSIIIETIVCFRNMYEGSLIHFEIENVPINVNQQISCSSRNVGAKVEYHRLDREKSVWTQPMSKENVWWLSTEYIITNSKPSN